MPTNTRIGITNSAICVPEPAAIPIDRSIFLFLARTIALLCSAALPTIPTIMVPTNISPKPNSLLVFSTDPTRISLTTMTPNHTYFQHKKRFLFAPVIVILFYLVLRSITMG